MVQFLAYSNIFMKIIIRQIKILLSILFVIFIVSFLLSQNANPNSLFLYNLKRLQEKTILKLMVSPQNNLGYQTKLLEKRLNEIVTITNLNEHSFILKSSLRYSTTAGQITEYILKNNMRDNISSTQDILKRHHDVLQAVVDKYPKDLDVEWKFIQDDINYIDIYSKMLRQSK